jgi:hypothetical protein
MSKKVKGDLFGHLFLRTQGHGSGTELKAEMTEKNKCCVEGNDRKTVYVPSYDPLSTIAATGHHLLSTIAATGHDPLSTIVATEHDPLTTIAATAHHP